MHQRPIQPSVSSNNWYSCALYVPCGWASQRRATEWKPRTLELLCQRAKGAPEGCYAKKNKHTRSSGVSVSISIYFVQNQVGLHSQKTNEQDNQAHNMLSQPPAAMDRKVKQQYNWEKNTHKSKLGLITNVNSKKLCKIDLFNSALRTCKRTKVNSVWKWVPARS